MNDLPPELDARIFTYIADDVTSIAQIQRVNKRFAANDTLWRMLLVACCPGFNPPLEDSLSTLKAFVRRLGHGDLTNACVMRVVFPLYLPGTYRLKLDLAAIKANRGHLGRRESLQVSVGGNAVAYVTSVGESQVLGCGYICIFGIREAGIVPVQLAYCTTPEPELKWIRLEGPFPRGSVVKVEPIWARYDKYGREPRVGQAGREDNGFPLFISMSKVADAFEIGKSGPHLSFHYAGGSGRERYHLDETYFMTNLSSFAWVRTSCVRGAVADLARLRGAPLAKSDNKILYAARIDFRGWQNDGTPAKSGRIVSVLPGKYVEGCEFPHFTWGGVATKSVFEGDFELLCYFIA